MDPEIGVGIGTERTTADRPRPPVLLRVLEMAGLALVVLGLASSRFLLALLGGVMVVVSYALYRSKHGMGPRQGPGPDGFGDDGGDGGD